MRTTSARINPAIMLTLLLATALFATVYFVINKSIRVGTIQEIKIDDTGDPKSLGYTGQRKIAVDNDSNIYVAYRKKFQNYFEIYVACISKTNGKYSISGIDKPISAIGKANQRVPSIAMDSKGTLHVVWYGSDDKNNENNRQIKYARSEDKGKTWSSWRNISYVSGIAPKDQYWQEHPSLSVGRDDTLYVTWEGKDELDQAQQIKLSFSINGGSSWSQWKNVSPTPQTTQSRPSLTENNDGTIYLFMYSSQNNANQKQQILYSSSSDKGVTWSNWQPISDSNVDSRHAASTADSDGNISVVWREFKAGDSFSKIYYRILSKNRWSQKTPVANSKNFQFFPSIGFDETSKNISVAWMETAQSSGIPNEDPQGGQSYISSFINGTFATPSLLTSSGFSMYPNLPQKSKTGQPMPVVYEQPSKNGYSLFLKVK